MVPWYPMNNTRVNLVIFRVHIHIACTLSDHPLGLEKRLLKTITKVEIVTVVCSISCDFPMWISVYTSVYHILQFSISAYVYKQILLHRNIYGVNGILTIIRWWCNVWYLSTRLFTYMSVYFCDWAVGICEDLASSWLIMYAAFSSTENAQYLPLRVEGCKIR